MSFDVLNRDLNVFAPHFLEASAGTGKTFAIEHLVTRQLLEGDSPLSIEEILVVTFTRAATRELKKRIRLNLWRTKEEMTRNHPSADYLKAICEKGESAIEEAAKRIEAALICYDTAQIYTLHGFCHRILNEFSFEAGVRLEVSDPEKKEHLAHLLQMIKEHLTEGIAVPDYSPVQIQTLLNRYRGDFRKMISSLIDSVENGREIAPIPTFGQLQESFLKAVRRLQNIEKSRLKADIALLRPLYKKMDEKEVSVQIDLLCEILESKNCNLEQFDQLLKGECFLRKMGPEHLKVRSKIPDTLHYPGLLECLRHSLFPLIQMAKDPSKIFLRLSRDLKEKSHQLLEQQEKFSPDNLLLKVQQATQLPSFAQRVRQKYRAAIIDEFQDTDPIQWSIFQSLFLSHIETICLVGDPKQSIYAFRNADVYTYLDAAKTLGTAARKHLDTNYRSTPPLVEALNLLFSRARGNWMSLPQTGEQLEVIPVKAGWLCRGCEGEVPLQFFVAIDKKGRSKKFPTPEMLEKKIFPFLASEIFSLHCTRGVEYHDIAILIKDRYMAKEVVDSLQQHGIPANFRRGAPITDSIAYFALKEILSAVCFPFDMGKIKAALGGALIGWNDAQLSKGLEDSPLLLAKAQMQSLNSILFEQGFGPFFQALLRTRWGNSPLSLLEEMLGRGELSVYLDLRRLAELLIEEATVRDLRGAAFLSFLDEIAIESHRDDSRLRTSLHEEKGSVLVMTMHMSKGLEFDTVFALGTASRHKLSEQIVVKKEGRSVMTIFDAEDLACKQALEEYDAEKMRQLYVALTRAKKRLYIPLFIDEEQKSIENGEASPIELFFANLIQKSDALPLNMVQAKEILESLSPQIHHRILEEIPGVSFAEQSASVELVPPSPLCTPCYDQQLFSFTTLAKKEHPVDKITLPREDSLSPHTMPLGSETGHLLHLIFEKIFKRGLHHPLDEKTLAELIEEGIAFSCLKKWKAVLLPWIVDLLKKKLTTFALADVPGDRLQQEMEFFFPVSKGMMKGFCDLFFEFEGKYYLLDWKSNYLGPADSDYTQEKIIQAMHSHDYFLQASIYASALERFVKLFDNRPFSECFGGAIYYFVRGKAAYHFVPANFFEKIVLEE
jgi:exodeoxyribonuclease V beta subunit